MSLRNHISSNLKKIRLSQPFNRIATSAVRKYLTLAGVESEFVISHLHRAGLVETELPNGEVLSLKSNADDWVSNQIFWRGWQGYEPETVPLFFDLARQSKVTLDIGAYVGFFSLLAGHANPNGHVYSFEPLKPVYDRLNSNIELNQLTNIETFLNAVGKKSEMLEFYYVSDTDLPTSSSLSIEFMREANNVISSMVPVLKIDDFVKREGLPSVDLIKIDTESTEPDILTGAKEILKRDKPTIFCEVLRGRGSEKQLNEIMRSHGYKFFLLTPEGPIRKEFVEGHPDWLNYLFIDSDSCFAET